MSTPLAHDAWTAQTQATIAHTLREIFDALAHAHNEKDADDLLVRARRFKDATDAWRTGTRTLTTDDLETLLDDVAALYGDVVARAAEHVKPRDLPPL